MINLWRLKAATLCLQRFSCQLSIVIKNAFKSMPWFVCVKGGQAGETFFWRVRRQWLAAVIKLASEKRRAP
ncbi:myo-inositol catabolism protein IolC [Pseudomonas fluvialis]|uniref:Myo-inositol catabolism protein IolC n=1 Tax=Pseudomonas fluvialis TaxID=1793966 RepID=A0A7X0BS22_9PSED|nr:hypothetical protein [Pseudomonas fluvialis]MBB6341817.1 myo-inositol catabolism protein IolC [Pseudomonas fluvialis]